MSFLKLCWFIYKGTSSTYTHIFKKNVLKNIIVLWYSPIGRNNFDLLTLTSDEMTDHSYHSLALSRDRAGGRCNEISCWNAYAIYPRLKNRCRHSYGPCTSHVIGCVAVLSRDHRDIYAAPDDYRDDHLIDHRHCDTPAYFRVGELPSSLMTQTPLYGCPDCWRV